MKAQVGLRYDTHTHTGSSRLETHTKPFRDSTLNISPLSSTFFEKNKTTRDPVCIPFSVYFFWIQTISQLELQNDFDMNDGSANKPEPPTSYVNDIELGEQAPDQEPPSPSAVTLESQPMPFHTLILDLAGVCFIDLMGIKVLTKVRCLFCSTTMSTRKTSGST